MSVTTVHYRSESQMSSFNHMIDKHSAWVTPAALLATKPVSLIFLITSYVTNSVYWQLLFLKNPCKFPPLPSFTATSNVTSVNKVRSTSTPLFPGTWHPPVMLLEHSITLRLFFIVKCSIVHFLCAMRVFKVQASCLSPRLPLCQI